MRTTLKVVEMCLLESKFYGGRKISFTDPHTLTNQTSDAFMIENFDGFGRHFGGTIFIWAELGQHRIKYLPLHFHKYNILTQERFS